MCLLWENIGNSIVRKEERSTTFHDVGRERERVLHRIPADLGTGKRLCTLTERGQENYLAEVKGCERNLTELRHTLEEETF